MKHTRTHNDNEKSFLTPNQAADFLNISLSTLKKLIYQGKIKTFKTPGGHHRILKSDLLSGHKTNDMKYKQAQMAVNDESILLEFVQALSAIIENEYKLGRGNEVAVSQISCEIAKVLRTKGIETAGQEND